MSVAAHNIYIYNYTCTCLLVIISEWQWFGIQLPCLIDWQWIFSTKRWAVVELSLWLF